LEDCVEKLPPDQRALVEGYYYERAEVGALAGRNGSTVAATYKMLQRIRQMLQVCVESQVEPDVA
jgi:DNA-directed RNA polymerase specialized sigma24 family protein